MFLETLRLALRAIRRNLLRSFLTVLGVVIGVAAVIAMVTIGNGTTAQVRAELTKLGTNVLYVRPGQQEPGGPAASAKGFTERDVAAIRDQIRGLRAVAPYNVTTDTVVAGGANRRTAIIGTTNDYLSTQDWTITSGRDFNAAENSGAATACIIGETVRSALFGAADPVGDSLRVGNVACNIVGVLAAKGDSGMGNDRDDVVLMPIGVFQRRIGGAAYIDNIILSARDGVSTATIQADVTSLLRESRNVPFGRPNDFEVNDMVQMAETMTGTTRTLTGLLGAVAAVSLLVGGIGIMNIMLVSVTERTREIGVRLAIGALERQVLTQFLVEAIALSIFGGIGGIVIGLAVAFVVVHYLAVPFVISLPVIAIAFAVSALIGVVFGYYPARRAARLSPIDALRHE
ncbi:FtsX-like permease family protein [Martelella alba]|uniref:FtsX-like permease family protein n=1 Tax=Martelella alba TaxID=2590451 RepID=A0A506UIB6_9HYPH|nr:ABC transporter permease [Martelella alba]TPW33056.1 FtsX-like permease family protein [Martelella alba]